MDGINSRLEGGQEHYRGFCSILALSTDRPPATLPPCLGDDQAVAEMQILTINGQPHAWHEAIANCYREGYLICRWPDGTNAAILNLKPAIPTKWVMAAYKAGRALLEQQVTGVAA